MEKSYTHRLFEPILQSTLGRLCVTEDRSLNRRKALAVLDKSILEYIDFSIPTGFKDWEPTIENIKQLVPDQKMCGFLSYNKSKKNSDDEDGVDSVWHPTSLFRLARLGIVAPLASAAGVHKHNMRCTFAGIIDAAVKPVGSGNKFSICSFALPDWKARLADRFKQELQGDINEHNLLLQDICYDKCCPDVDSLASRLDALGAFMRGSLSWMLLDMPIGGDQDVCNMFRFDYAYGQPIRRAISHIEQLITGSVSDQCIDRGSRRYYGRGRGDEFVYPNIISPKGYSGLHASVHTSDNKVGASSSYADLRRAVLLALLYPGMLADQGIVIAHVISRSRDDAGCGVEDLAKVGIRHVNNDLQETIWKNNITMCASPGILPVATMGLLEYENVDNRSGAHRLIPLDFMNEIDSDHQSMVDSVFGNGYVRMLTSKSIGREVKTAVREVLLADGIPQLMGLYEKWRDRLNELCPLSEHAPGGMDRIISTFGLGAVNANTSGS